MWTLLLLTVLSTEPPRMRYEHYASFSTREKCLEISESMRKQTPGKIQTYCVYDRS